MRSFPNDFVLKIAILSLLTLSSLSCPDSSNLSSLAELSTADLKKLLSSCQISAHIKDKNGWNILHEAAREGNVEVVRYMTWSGIDVNRRTNGKMGANALWIARNSLGDRHAVVKFLESIGASELGPRAKSLQTILQRQRSRSKPDVDDGRFDAHAAAKRGDARMLRYLMQQERFDVNQRNDNGLTMLHEAAQSGHEEVIALLVESGAYVYMEDEGGDDALDMANRRFQCNHTAVKYLEQFG